MKTGSLVLDRFLPYRLSVLSNRISSSIAAHYRNGFGISIAEWRVLAVLGEAGGITAGEVALRTAMDKVGVSRAVQRLVNAGLLRRRASQRDGRIAHLELSARGRRTYTRIAPLALAYEQSLLRTLSASDRVALDRILGKLNARVAALDQ